MSTIKEKQDLPSTGRSPFAVFSIIVAILMVFVIILAAVLYSWVTPLPGYPKGSPIGSMYAAPDGDGAWDVTILKMSPTVSINAIHWYLLDVQGFTVVDGSVREIYGFQQGEGKSIIYFDADYNAKVSPSDVFRFYPGEGDSLTNVTSLDDYSLRIKFAPTDDSAAYDVTFTDETT